MTDEKKPLDDVRDGLGLLFRAAKKTIEKLPTKDIEKTVSEGVTEIGKAMGRVVEAVEKEVKKVSERPADKGAAGATAEAPKAEADANPSSDEKSGGDETPKQ